MEISAIILAKNEEENIKECLKGLKWCNELIVIDDYSEDKTAKIAKDLGAKVYRRSLNNNFAAQRNFGLSRTKGEWVFFVDADERVSPVLASEIKEKTRGRKYNGFFLKRQDYFGRKKLNHGETSKVRLLRLGRKDSGSWQREVHETWLIKGKAGELNNPLLHYPHQTISEFLKEINFYSTLHAKALSKEGVKGNLWRIVFYPLAKFLQNYFLRLGFLDRMPGFIVASMMSWHSFLAQSKLYLKRK